MSQEELEEYVFEIGFSLNQEFFYKEAKNLLSNFHPKFPYNENILFELAYSHDKLEEVDEGIEVYNKLLDINAYLENAWYNLGILYNKKRKICASY